MEIKEPRRKNKGFADKLVDWYMHFIIYQIPMSCLCFILGLTFINGGPLTISIADKYNLVLLPDSLKPSAFTGQLLVVFGFAELIGLDFVGKVISKVLDPILKPILAPIFTHPKVKNALMYISSKLPKEKDDGTDRDDENQVS